MRNLESAMVAPYLSHTCQAPCQTATMICANSRCKCSIGICANSRCKCSIGILEKQQELVAVCPSVCRCDALAVFHETVENSMAQSKACDFLVSKQRKDGGWAESYLSSQTKVCLQDQTFTQDVSRR